jgi:hypothetical protein
MGRGKRKTEELYFFLYFIKVNATLLSNRRQQAEIQTWMGWDISKNCFQDFACLHSTAMEVSREFKTTQIMLWLRPRVAPSFP